MLFLNQDLNAACDEFGALSYCLIKVYGSTSQTPTEIDLAADPRCPELLKCYNDCHGSATFRPTCNSGIPLKLNQMLLLLPVVAMVFFVAAKM